MSQDHGHCPHCNADMNGGSIWQTFFERTGSEEEADKSASMYGATRDSGCWGRVIALYCQDRDRTVGFKCPDCHGEWER